MPTREQVRRLLDDGLDYQAAAAKLGIPPGQAYMIVTGVPADGSGTITDEEAGRPGFLPSSQHLANPPHETPTTKDSVAAWLKARVASDAQMRTALRSRTAEPPEPETESENAIDALDKMRDAAGDRPAERTGQPGEQAVSEQGQQELAGSAESEGGAS